MTTVLYPGSFDPPTLGHIDVIRRGAQLFDRLVVAVGAHHSKSGRFSVADRIAMLEEIAGMLVKEGASITVMAFDGLVVDAAREAGAVAILRGIRNVTDLEYEDQMAGMNHALMPGIDTVFLTASQDVRHIASSLVYQIAALGGSFEKFVTPAVADRLRAKLAADRLP